MYVMSLSDFSSASLHSNANCTRTDTLTLFVHHYSPSSQSLPRMLDEWMKMKNVCPEVRGQDLDHHLSWLPGLPQWAPRAPTSSPLTLSDPTLPQFCPHSRCYPSPSISPKVHFQALGLPRDVLGCTSPCHPDLPSQLGLLLSLPEAA